MPGTFSPPPWVSDPDMHHSTCVTHVSWCMRGSLTSGFLLSRWRRKRSRYSRRMRNTQFYVSGKRPIEEAFTKFGSLGIELTFNMSNQWKFKYVIYWHWYFKEINLIMVFLILRHSFKDFEPASYSWSLDLKTSSRQIHVPPAFLYAKLEKSRKLFTQKKDPFKSHKFPR